jgi:hypothetical protein
MIYVSPGPTLRILERDMACTKHVPTVFKLLEIRERGASHTNRTLMLEPKSASGYTTLLPGKLKIEEQTFSNAGTDIG